MEQSALSLDVISEETESTHLMCGLLTQMFQISHSLFFTLQSDLSGFQAEQMEIGYSFVQKKTIYNHQPSTFKSHSLSFPARFEKTCHIR